MDLELEACEAFQNQLDVCSCPFLGCPSKGKKTGFYSTESKTEDPEAEPEVFCEAKPKVPNVSPEPRHTHKKMDTAAEPVKALAKLDAVSLLTAVQSLSPEERMIFLQLAGKITKAAPAKKRRAAKIVKPKEDNADIALFNQFYMLESNVRANMCVADQSGAIIVDPTPFDFNSLRNQPAEVEQIGAYFDFHFSNLLSRSVCENSCIKSSLKSIYFDAQCLASGKTSQRCL